MPFSGFLSAHHPFLGKTLLAFDLLRLYKGQICPLFHVSLDFCIPIPYNEKDIFLGC